MEIFKSAQFRVNLHIVGCVVTVVGVCLENWVEIDVANTKITKVIHLFNNTLKVTAVVIFVKIAVWQFGRVEERFAFLVRTVHTVNKAEMCFLFALVKSVRENLIENLALTEAMKKLNERELGIIKRRYYRGRTQMEIAEEIGISQAQVSRLEKAAIDKLRKYMN